MALGFAAQVSSRFLKGHFHWPTAGKPFDAGLGRLAGVGREQGPRFEAAPGRARQHPAKRHLDLARVIPEGGARGHLDSASALAVPMHPEPLPTGARVFCARKPKSDSQKATKATKGEGFPLEGSRRKKFPLAKLHPLDPSFPSLASVRSTSEFGLSRVARVGNRRPFERRTSLSASRAGGGRGQTARHPEARARSE